MYATNGAHARQFYERDEAARRRDVFLALTAATATGAQFFASLRCPVCKARAASYQGNTGDMKCERGHVSRKGQARPAPAPVATAPVARSLTVAPARVAKLPPLPGNVGHVMVQGAISASPRTGRTAGMLHRDLDEVKARGAKAVVVHVGSGGGDLAEAEGMARRIRLLSAMGVATVAHVTNASSAASVVALACDYSVTAPEGEWLVHEPVLNCPIETVEQLSTLHGARAKLREHYQRHSTMSAAEVGGLMSADIGHFTSEGALGAGLTDEVGDEARAVAVAAEVAAGLGLPRSERRLALASRRRA